ncbi:MAG TPA: STAS domain-containing protein [Burkholderiales bacterium]|nr:STAS domain-containing protein [Burkholderiales bacterium]
MPRREGNRLFLDGDLTVDTVAGVLADTSLKDRSATEVVDFAAVTEVDSAAIALAIAWLREARAAGRPLRFENLPPAMGKLARLYAVADLIPGA